MCVLEAVRREKREGRENGRKRKREIEKKKIRGRRERVEGEEKERLRK